MNKIFVHIGLPKTATTSLQLEVFPNIYENEITFFGVLQPRKTTQNNLYGQFLSTINNQKNINQTIESLRAELEKGKDILFSEELIVTSNKTVSWQDKLNTLFKVIRNFNYRIIVTIREPLQAMFSYYVELYHIFNKENISFTQLALNNNDMYIYHYRKFFTVLFSIFDSDLVIVKKFEDLIEGNITGILGEEYPINNKISKTNSKKESKNYVIKSKYYSVWGILRYFDRRGFLIEQFNDKTKEQLNNIGFKKKYKIKKPKEDELEFLYHQLKDELIYINRDIKIGYQYDKRGE